MQTAEDVRLCWNIAKSIIRWTCLAYYQC